VATIEFYSGIADKAHHALRLLRKAQAKGARVAVVGDAAALRRLDADLWTSDARDFVPHVRVDGPPPGRSEGGPVPSGGSERSERGGTFGPPPGRSEGEPVPSGGPQPSARMDRTPLWLVEDVRIARRCQVLVNLGPDAVEALDGFERVIELVSTDPDDRQTGRARWRRYEAMGHTIRHTPMDNQASPASDGDPHGE
jgi:DNA polymerase-3 subunit chi